MDVIDGNWIKARLPKGEHGAKAALAEAMGISRDKLSKILNGQRQVQPSEIPGVLSYFAPSAAEGSLAPGFSESSVEAFTPKVATLAETALRLSQKAGTHPTIYRARRDVTSAHVRRGDLLVVDLNGQPAPGDLVVCTIADPDTDVAGTHLRRWFPPWLIDEADGVQAGTDDGSAAILGNVLTVVREA